MPVIPDPTLLPRLVCGGENGQPARLINIAGGERPMFDGDLYQLLAYLACELRYGAGAEIVIPGYGLPPLPRRHALLLIEEAARLLGGAMR